MSSSVETIVEIGSRSGAFVALAFFSTVFVLLGWGGAKVIANHGASRGLAGVFGLALFGVPLWLVYLSSLDGFYEAKLSSNELTLTYLFRKRLTLPPVQLK